MIKKLHSLFIKIFGIVCAMCLVAFGFVGIGTKAYADETDGDTSVSTQPTWNVEPSVKQWVYGNFDANVNVFYAEAANVSDGANIVFSVRNGAGDALSPSISVQNGDVQITKTVSLENIAVEYISVEDDNYYRITNSVENDNIKYSAEEYALALNTLPVGAYKLYVRMENSSVVELDKTVDFKILDRNTWTISPNIISWTYGNFNAELNVLYGQAAVLPESDMSDVQPPEIMPDGDPVISVQHDRVHFSILDMTGSPVTAMFERDGEETYIELDDIDVQLNFGESNNEYYSVVGDYVDGINALPVNRYILHAWVNEVEGEYGAISEDVTFGILQARNGWVETPNIIRWTYGDFDRDVNLISAKPLYYSNISDITFAITDEDGVVLDGLNAFTVTDKGIVSVQTEEKLKALHAGAYRLTATVVGTDNYSGIENQSIAFNVLQSPNEWKTYPSIESWKDGEFNSEVNMPVAEALWGTAVIVITDTDTGEEVYYDSVNGINRLNEMRPESYRFTVSVEGNNDYRSLEKMFIFRVFESEDIVVGGGGLPWWAVLLIVLGALAVVAVVFVVLHVKGILRMFTTKMLASFRAKADIDATIAAVRVGKITAYAQHTMMQLEASDREQQALLDAENEKNLALAAAQAKEEKKAARRAAALAEKARSPEEKAAALEQKASAMKERAAALKARAQATEQKAAEVEEKAAAMKIASQASNNQNLKKAEALEKKAKETEAKAEELKARADIVRDIAASRAEKSGAHETVDSKEDQSAAAAATSDQPVDDATADD